MRLICPNCGATYEVDASLIPPEGRDVQCSNCGHGWFQAPDGEADAEAEAQAALVDEGDAERADENAPEAAEEETARRRRELEPGIADILREEAEREAAARRAEQSATLESQPDLGLDEAPAEEERDRSAAARARMARLRGMEDGDGDAEDRHGARKEVLPDVDEINSTLRGQEERGEMPEPAPAHEPKGRGGFRFGFLLVVLLCAILVGVYALAPRIAEMFPGLTPTLTAYVDWVNMMRGQVNALVESGVAWVQGMLG
ncbi:zinc-ribbon domain-containing protein [Psychromarinibacter sp. C21-152]|uniref:Zinc-ribbon domain-containing protein n=1 Tax=Psychromarinibacter sediminicola TaxID=3033385 RepID=A0AAE3NWU0_9RHOB|nr:zinc-ribbon domain-containing protein [Psychromarinibacter sediminicola]MDF0603582.1 zinc-ribbon domain-containing protein [Psychromarinibacter sediminicola]